MAAAWVRAVSAAELVDCSGAGKGGGGKGGGTNYGGGRGGSDGAGGGRGGDGAHSSMT